MNLKVKILLLCILPLSLALATTTFFVQRNATLLVEQQVAALEKRVVAEKQQELENYIELALTSIEPLVSDIFDDEIAEALAGAQVKRVLENMTFSDDGYFFVYKMDGISVLHPKQPWRVGENWWHVQDENGKFIIQDLIKAAQDGGGFVSYLWERPSTGENERKISYAVKIESFDWMIGTGVYLDEVDGLVAALRADVEDRVGDIFTALWLIFAACVLGIGLFASALAYRETSFANTALRRVYNKLVDVQEEERSRVSRDLHDGISQILVSAKYELAVTKSRYEQAPDIGKAKIDTSLARIDEALKEVRRISADLRPKDLDDLGLAAALRSLGQRFAASTNLETRVSALPVNDLITPDQKSALYRIAQEALTNIRRHSAASNVEIHLDRESDALILTVYDDGVGFGHDERNAHSGLRGLGLRNMEERLAAFSGYLRVNTRGDGKTGTKLQAVMPLAQTRNKPWTLLTTDAPS